MKPGLGATKPREAGRGSNIRADSASLLASIKSTHAWMSFQGRTTTSSGGLGRRAQSPDAAGRTGGLPSLRVGGEAYLSVVVSPVVGPFELGDLRPACEDPGGLNSVHHCLGTRVAEAHFINVIDPVTSREASSTSGSVGMAKDVPSSNCRATASMTW